MFGLYFALLTVGLAFGAPPRNGNRCETPKCEIKPFDLRFWYQGIETELRQININEGDDIIITCDGSCVGSSENPRLSWYGPNLKRIDENSNNRTYTEKSLSGQFSRLILNDVTANMSGRYTCRGWLGQRMGWRKKEIIIAVDRLSNLEITRKTTIPVDVSSHVNNLSKFMCAPGAMIDASKVCDGFPDCQNGNDDRNCVIGSVCNEGSVACADNEKCLPRNQICDSVVHCRDGSDELPFICNV
ncbi:hypothetical protein CHS0354_016364 [Potamilus streckersoni]|uniref:Ig-like domain-containing protein n=1 Tax=Potamilus streckersoni TaxID=2493646 RepID=A0AAE0SVS8_9BIVA|nr:hypothetical protein CHS0354_016364 [Potamilus streckersoni]